MDSTPDKKQNSLETSDANAGKSSSNWRENPEIVELVAGNPELAAMLDTPDFEIILAEFIQSLLDQNEM